MVYLLFTYLQRILHSWKVLFITGSVVPFCGDLAKYRPNEDPDRIEAFAKKCIIKLSSVMLRVFMPDFPPAHRKGRPASGQCVAGETPSITDDSMRAVPSWCYVTLTTYAMSILFFSLIAIIVVLVAYQKIAFYYKGKAWEEWCKAAHLVLYKKIRKDFGEEKMSRAILNKILFFDDEEDIKEFTAKNRELVERTTELLMNHPGFHDLIFQTLFVRCVVAQAKGDHDTYEKIWNSEVFKKNFSPARDIKSYMELIINFRTKNAL